jgi:HSP90 family molecular chaperone
MESNLDVNLFVQLRNPKEVTKEDYNEFYKKTFNEYLEPLASSHFTTEVKELFLKCNLLMCDGFLYIYIFIKLEDIA